MLIHVERGRGWCYLEMREHCSQLEHVDTCGHCSQHTIVPNTDTQGKNMKEFICYTEQN